MPVAGVAWAQHRGIARVEVRVDGGDWHVARLSAGRPRTPGGSGSGSGTPRPGSHTLEVRATDRDGRTQTQERQGTVPDGATGWHSVVVEVP